MDRITKTSHKTKTQDKQNNIDNSTNNSTDNKDTNQNNIPNNMIETMTLPSANFAMHLDRPSDMIGQHGSTNDELSIIIEDYLLRIIPTIDKAQAKHLSKKLSSLKSVQQSIGSSDETCLKEGLKRVSKLLLRMAKDRKSQFQSAKKIAPQSPPQHSAASAMSRRVSNESSTSINDHKAKAERHHILVDKMGEETYDEILRVTYEIEDIRKSSAVWTKFTRKCSYSHDDLLPCEPSFDENEEKYAVPVSKALPSPISDIYFRTRLGDAMRVVESRTTKQWEDVPPPCACVVQRVNWEELLRDAKEKLAAFRQFERENVKPGEDLSFRCGSGMCSFSPRGKFS